VLPTAGTSVEDSSPALDIWIDADITTRDRKKTGCAYIYSAVCSSSPLPARCVGGPGALVPSPLDSIS
jgi:hypothetical protein